MAFIVGWIDRGEARIVGVLLLLVFYPAGSIPEVWLHARLEARGAVLAQWIALVLGALARVLLVQVGAPVLAFAAVFPAEAVVSVALVWISARRYGFSVGKWQSPRAKELAKDAWPLLLSGIAVLLYMRVDVLMLNGVKGSESAGVYAAAARFTELWYFLPVVISSSVLPMLMRAKEASEVEYRKRFQLVFDLSVSAACALAASMTVAAKYIIELAYGPAYAGAVGVMRLHAWSLVFVFLGVIRGQYLVIESLTGFYLISVLCGLLFNIAGNALLIPSYGAEGAAIATLLAQAVAALISSFCYQPVRVCAWMQARALTLPMRLLNYVRRN